MKQFVARAVVLSRTDYGEADRILTLLTPEFGKLSVLARGVRRVKSKLAGGIELFSVSQITFTKGRGSLGMLISARLEKHYGTIVRDLERTMTGYELIKRLHHMTEDEPEPEYFEVLVRSFEALDDATIPLPIIHVWFAAQLLQLSGHTPNLQTDNQSKPLQADLYYAFDLETMSFMASPDNGQYGTNHIKLLRLAMNASTPQVLARIQGSAQLCKQLVILLQNIQKQTGIIR